MELAKEVTLSGGTIDGSSSNCHYAIYKSPSCAATVSRSGTTIKGLTYGI